MAEEEPPMDTPMEPPQEDEPASPLEETAPEPAAAAESSGENPDAPEEAPSPEDAEAAADAPEELPLEGADGLTLKRVVEALVFASPKPITTKEIVAALKAAAERSEDAYVKALGKVKAAAVEAALAEVAADLEANGRAFQLVEKVSGWVLVSEPKCAPWVRQLYPEAKPTRLSGPQLETLAIIAYRQPVTRADIEAVRGVSVDGVMQVLLDRSLVKIAGRADVPGRPLLYSTTDYFLEHFGLKTTDELPNASELKRIPLPTAPVPEEKPAEAAPAEATANLEAPEPAAEPAAEAVEEPAAEPTEEPVAAAESAEEPSSETEDGPEEPAEPVAEELPPGESPTPEERAEQ